MGFDDRLLLMTIFVTSCLEASGFVRVVKPLSRSIKNSMHLKGTREVGKTKRKMLTYVIATFFGGAYSLSRLSFNV